MLSDAGLHIIDMGFPSAAPSERRALELILEGKQQGPHPARPRDHRDVPVERPGHRRHPRHAREDGGRGPTTARSSSSPPGSDLHLKYKIGKTLLALEGRKPEEWLDLPVSFYREANIRMACAAIAPRAQPRGAGDRVRRRGRLARRRGLPDRAGPGLLRGGGHALLVPRHRRLLRAGGRGLLHPEARGRVPRPSRWSSTSTTTSASAAYNTVRALHHGATIPTCTVNGLGERAGNAPLHTTVMILKELYGVDHPRLPLRHAVGAAAQGGGVQRPAGGGRASRSSATTSSATRPGSTPPGSRSTPRSTR